MEYLYLLLKYLLLILTVLGVIIGILYLYSQYDYDVYKYKCHHCKKKFKGSDIKDLRGPWHTKDWTCPHCKYQNVTPKGYDY